MLYFLKGGKTAKKKLMKNMVMGLEATNRSELINFLQGSFCKPTIRNKEILDYKLRESLINDTMWI